MRRIDIKDFLLFVVMLIGAILQVLDDYLINIRIHWIFWGPVIIVLMWNIGKIRILVTKMFVLLITMKLAVDVFIEVGRSSLYDVTPWISFYISLFNIGYYILWGISFWRDEPYFIRFYSAKTKFIKIIYKIVSLYFVYLCVVAVISSCVLLQMIFQYW
ncbi:MAG: hypothetical protein ACOCT9_03085 [archaeon]